MEEFPSTFVGLVQLAERLRSPTEGCPWDREQTRKSLKRLFLEECYELIEAMEEDDAGKLVEELGDVLFHAVFQIQIGRERGEFTPEQVFISVIDKLVRRHPHVFKDVDVADARDVKVNWDAIKRKEMAGTDASILDGVPKQMPALSYAQSVQERAARAGLDWDELPGVLANASEELVELEKAGPGSETETELGDLLFSLVNVSRWNGTDAEGALRQANARFYRRFSTMERLSRERELDFAELPMEQKEALWEEAKRIVG